MKVFSYPYDHYGMTNLQKKYSWQVDNKRSEKSSMDVELITARKQSCNSSILLLSRKNKFLIQQTLGDTI